MNTEVGIIMGSRSDWETMQHTSETLDSLGIGYEVKVVSAHRTPERVADFAKNAAERGFAVIIAGAGGAAHLAGVIASMTVLPVIGVPIGSSALGGLDSLLSTVQMPQGVPVATVTIGAAGAVNAAVLALQILGTSDPEIRNTVRQYKKELAEKVAKQAEEIRKHS